MTQYKIIHIHTDYKFIDNSIKFELGDLDNIVIVIGNKSNYKGSYYKNAIFHKFSTSNLRSIIKICSTAHMVVLYDLNFPKAYIANRLPKSVKVVWRFFGLEVYQRIPGAVFSEQTIKASAEIAVKYDYLFF